MNVAEYICHYLSAYRVQHIFGYPGASILPLMTAIDDHPQLKWVLMRHEGSAVLAASAQGKLRDHLSVCMATSGPGATNLLTGMLDAELDRSPVLAITGLVPTIKHGLSYFQEVDQIDILKASCGFSARCENPMQAVELLQAAVGYVIKNKKVAHFSIAQDVQLTEFTPEQLPVVMQHLKALHYSIELLMPPSAAIDIVKETLSHYENIIIAVGARARGAGKQIEFLSEKLQAPMISTFSGKGVINETHPHYFGVLGLFGTPANLLALKAIENAKLVLSFGVDDIVYFLTDKDINQKRDFIQCEPNVTCINHQFIQKRILLGCLDKIAFELAERITSPYASSFLKNILNKKIDLNNQYNPAVSQTHMGTVHQTIFLEKLNPLIDKEKLILCLDIGDNAVWSIMKIQLTHYQKTLVSNRLGTMGFCLPAMIAAKLDKPDHLVVGICGDGGFQMSLGEFMTAVQEKLNLFLIIFNNGMLQRVVAQQKKMFGTFLENPDYSQFAKSCGATSYVIDHPNDIQIKLKEAFSVTTGPVLIDVRCDPETYASLTNWTC